jgi:segregation and condensation protein B
MNMNPEQVQRILEAALLVSGRPMSAADLQKLFDEADAITAKEIRDILITMQTQYADKGIELRELASGFQYQAKAEYSPWLSRLWEERAPRYSRAVLETIALIAYRQPITRSEIEEIRGVAVSSHIIKTLQEREWIKVVGYRDVPGKPALFATTKTFLDHLNLKALDELPALSEVLDLEGQEQKLQVQLELSATPENEQAETKAHDHAAEQDETALSDTSDQENDTQNPSKHTLDADAENVIEAEANLDATDDTGLAETEASEATTEIHEANETVAMDNDCMDFSPEEYLEASPEMDSTEATPTLSEETNPLEQETSHETHQIEHSESE